MKNPQKISKIKLRQIKQKFVKPSNIFDKRGNAVRSLVPLYTRLVIGVICLVFTPTIAWATFNKVDEVADTQGKIVPSNPVEPVRSPTGGRIRDIKVNENQHVQRGDLLVRLDPIMSQAEIQRLEQLSKLNREKLTNLEAERTGKGTSLQNQRTSAATASLNRQAALLKQSKARLATLQENLAGAKSDVPNSKVNLTNAENLHANNLKLKPKAGSSLTIAQEKANSHKFLYQNGAVSRQQHQTVEDEVNKSHLELIKIQSEIIKSSQEVATARNKVNDAQGKVISLQKDIAAQTKEVSQAQKSYQVAENNITRLEAEHQKATLAQINKLQIDIRNLDGKVAQAKEQNNHRTIIAPASGYIHKNKINKVLTTIKPGDELLTIVTDDEELIAEVKVNKKDITLIKENMLAKVKLANSSHVGTLEGKVETVPKPISDKNGRLFYISRIGINEHLIKNKADKKLFIPGAVVNAKIVIREKTIMSSFLESIRTNLTKVFAAH